MMIESISPFGFEDDVADDPYPAAVDSNDLHPEEVPGLS